MKGIEELGKEFIKLSFSQRVRILARLTNLHHEVKMLEFNIDKLACGQKHVRIRR